MDTNGIASELDTFASWPRSFAFQELSDFADSDVDRHALRRRLLSDCRFVCVRGETSDDGHFIPESALFRWLTHLNLRLLHARQARLSQRQLARGISSLRRLGRWETPPPEFVQFGERLGLLGNAYTSGQYVFPIAQLLLSMSPFCSELAANLLRSSVEVRKPRALPEASLRELIGRSLALFGERVAYVVQARQGLLGGEKLTLEQTGARLSESSSVRAVTRERIRQLDAKFWRTLREPRTSQAFLMRKAFMQPLLVALLCDIMGRQGSLILGTDSPETAPMRFIAECAGITPREVPDTELVVLGTTPLYALASEGCGWSPNDIDADIIARHLDSEGQPCLVGTDLKTLAERAAQSRRQRLTRAQRVYLALRNIGKPAHYSAVAEEYNRLFPDAALTEYNVHAVLSLQQHGVVWIRARGMFALKEWGYERPSKGLFDAVAEIVEKRYEATGKPVSFTVIAAEIGKYRRLVKPSSLTFAAHLNRRLRRVSGDSFVPRAPDDEVEEEIAEDELDRILQEFEGHLGDSSEVSAAGGQGPADGPALPKPHSRIARLGSVLHQTVRRLTGTIQTEGVGENSLTALAGRVEPAAWSEVRPADVRASGVAEETGETWHPQPVRGSERARRLIESAQSKGLEVIDERPNGGYLWIVGGKELYSFLSPRGFVWGPRGVPATGNRPGWYLLED